MLLRKLQPERGQVGRSRKASLRKWHFSGHLNEVREATMIIPGGTVFQAEEQQGEGHEPESAWPATEHQGGQPALASGLSEDGRPQGGSAG